MSASYGAPTGMSPAEKDAYLKGYNDCKKGQEASGGISLTPPPFSPPAGFETAYKAGWDSAVSKAVLSGRRGEGLGHIKIGGVIFVLGLVVTIGSMMYSPDGSFWVAYGAIIVGAINIVKGIWKFFSSQSAE